MVNDFEDPHDCPETFETLLEKVEELNKRVQANTEEILELKQRLDSN